MTDPLAPAALDEWERLARAATPGPWQQTHDIKRGVKLWGADSSPLFLSIGGLAHSRITPEDPIPQWQKDCDFVRACSPERILGLIAAVRAVSEQEQNRLAETEKNQQLAPGLSRDATVCEVCAFPKSEHTRHPESFWCPDRVYSTFRAPEERDDA